MITDPRLKPSIMASGDYGFDEIDAHMRLSQAGRIRLGNMVDPEHTMGASILRKYPVS